MKTQLLEDINEVASQPRARPLEETRFAGPAGAVWRPRPQPEPEARALEPEVRPPEPEVRQPETEVRPPEPEAREQTAEPELTEEQLAAYAKERDEWLSEQIKTKPNWFDRWGRRVATWSAGVAAAILVAGGGLWLYQEQRIDNTLVLVAKSSIPAQKVAPSPVKPVPAAAPATSVELVGSPQQETAPPEVAVQPKEVPIQDAVPVTEKPIVRKSPDAVPAAPVRHIQKRVSAKARPPAPVVAAELKPTHLGQMEETLRLCRAAGYHAAQCAKRGCVATKYGLACKG